MKRFLVAFALAGLLAVSALAGDISTSGAPTPASNGTSVTTTSMSPGDVPTVGVAEQLSSDALSALLSVLSFLAV
ncbi:MAG: hypothetical protein ACREA9_19415 [Pyrinomonadaceae bacterium]